VPETMQSSNLFAARRIRHCCITLKLRILSNVSKNRKLRWTFVTKLSRSSPLRVACLKGVKYYWFWAFNSPPQFMALSQICLCLNS